VENAPTKEGKVKYIRASLLFCMAIVFIAGAAWLSVLMGLEHASTRAAFTAHSSSFLPTHNTGQRKPGAVLHITFRPTAPEVYKPLSPMPPASSAALSSVTYRIPTSEPVIFLTIDDGVTPNEKALDLMRQHRAVASLFLNDANIHRHYDYFLRWQDAGSTIQDHTINHPHLTRLPYIAQKTEICGNADRFANVFGERPTLLRPPYGEFNDTTRRAAEDCGQKHLVHWSVTANGGLHYQNGSHLQPGDIVLLHFTPTLDQELQTVFDAAQQQHLYIGRLEDWLR
jgi:peptidoglycan/xylan/chitin deacetylase (PgdA/CDA1 family)